MATNDGLRAELDELLKLQAAATPGPWRSMRDGNQYLKTKYMPTAVCVGASRVDPLQRPWNPHAYLAFGFTPKEFETARFTDADGDFIASIHRLTSLCERYDAALVAAQREPVAPPIEQSAWRVPKALIECANTMSVLSHVHDGATRQGLIAGATAYAETGLAALEHGEAPSDLNDEDGCPNDEDPVVPAAGDAGREDTYRQGFLLDTPQTRRWSDEQRKAGDAEERRMVFKNFNARDQGRSRELLCECRTEEQAAAVVAAIRSHK